MSTLDKSVKELAQGIFICMKQDRKNRDWEMPITQVGSMMHQDILAINF